MPPRFLYWVRLNPRTGDWLRGAPEGDRPQVQKDPVPRFLTRPAVFALLALLSLSPGGLAAQTPGGQGDVRLGDDVLPTFEAIQLRVDPGQKEYSGRVVVDLTARRTTGAFHFHALGQTLSRVALTRVGGKGEDLPLRTEVDERGLVTARPGEPLVPGSYRLEIAFTQAFNTRSVGLYRTEKDGRSYAFTQLEAADARRAFPCWDEPGVKIPYQLTVEVPAAHLAVSNTPIEKEARESAGEAGFKTVVFKRTPPLPAYLLALASGPFEVTPIPGLSVPGRVITIAGQSRLAANAAQVVPPVLAALERWFGRPYPFEKLDLIAAPEFWPGAMENPGAIVFADSVLLLDPARATGHDRLRLASITAHEIAHQWFGDLVTMAWWDDLWLNESFADWLADKITDQVYPQWKQGTTVRVDINGVMGEDARPSAAPIRRPIRSPDEVLENSGVVYEKGKAVLAMFEVFLGPETFRRGVHDYLREHAWGNATSRDLWSALGRAAGRDVGAAMTTFVDQPGLPLVRVELLPGGRLALSQERFTNAGVPLSPLAWKIPVGLKYGDGQGVRTTTVLLEAARQEVTLPGTTDVSWVMPDLGGAGYYRFSLPPERLTQLAKVATLPAPPLDARERIAFLCNLTALLSAGLVHGDTFLAAATPFAADPEPLVVTALVDQLAAVRQALVPEALAHPFAGYVRRTFRPVLDRIGRAARPGEEPNLPALRSQLLLWLGDEGRDPEVIHYGESLARRYLAAPGSVDPELADAALTLGALAGDRALFADYRRHFENARTPVERGRYRKALGRFRDPAVQEEILRFALSGALRPSEILRTADGLAETERGAERYFLWVRENYDAIAERVPPILLPALPSAAGGCSAERLELGERFFAEPGHSVPGTGHQLASIADQVHDCLRLRQREGPAVAGYLSRRP
jgi:alanyl aminopeptidase